VPRVTLVSFAGRGNAGDDLPLLGTAGAVRALAPDLDVTAVVAASEPLRAFLHPDVRTAESPLRTLEAAVGPSHEGHGRRAARAADRLLRAALDRDADVPAPVRDSVEAVRAADLVLFVGGGYLSDRWPLGLAVASMLGNAASRSGVPYSLFGHSVGPFEHGGPLPRALHLLHGAERIAIREPRSSWEVAALLRGRQAQLLGDPALLVPRPAPPAEWPARVLANFRGVRKLAEYRKEPDEPALTLSDGVYMAARQLRAEVCFVEAGAEPAFDDGTGNRTVDAGLLANVPRGAAVAYAGGRLDLPPASVLISTRHDMCAWALGNGLPAVGVALTPHDRHELRGLMDLFGRPDWVWVPEAEYGVHDLSGRATQAAADPNRAQLRETADGLAEKQRAWLADLLQKLTTA